MTGLWPGFLIGFLGSFHCVAMCSPLMLSIPFGKGNSLNVLKQGFVYQLGRVLSYVAIGLLFYSVGKSFELVILQNGISIFIGALLFIYGFLKVLRKSENRFEQRVIRFLNLPKLYERLRGRRNGFTKLVLGMANGLLPCGLVYMAAVTSVLAVSPQQNILFMTAFGFGTIPTMLSVLVLGKNMKSLGAKLYKATPFILMLMGCYFVLRGMELGIPYVSPTLPVAGDSTAVCAN